MADEQSSGIEVAPGVYASEAELRFHFSRSGGPGGQNVNKVSSKAELRVRLDALRGLMERARWRLLQAQASRITADGELLIVADTSRSQSANRQECLGRLRAMLLGALKEPKVRKKTKPTWSSQQRRLDSKKARSRVKERRRDFGE